MNKKKLLIILGPTASGKTKLAVRLAPQFNAEIISADSRQVYQRMDIVTGKDKEVYNSVSVWGLDLVRPDESFSLAHWLNFTQEKIKKTWGNNKLPIVVGGIGFWIKALLKPAASVGIAPDFKLRNKLRKLSVEQLQQMLKKKDRDRFEKMNKSDKNNYRRLIRAIEISGKLPTVGLSKQKKAIKDYLIIGLKTDNNFLYQRIDQRVDKRVKQGAFKETEELIEKGYSSNLASMSSIGYKQVVSFFKKEKSKEEVIQAWKYAEHGYARRQMTFFKKIEGIHWFNIKQKKYEEKVVKLIKSWYIDNNAGKN